MPPPPLLQGLRLLVVEDEAMVAMLVEDMLTDLGCVVVGVAGTVAEGLAVVGSGGVALDGAVLDVNVGAKRSSRSPTPSPRGACRSSSRRATARPAWPPGTPTRASSPSRSGPGC